MEANNKVIAIDVQDVSIVKDWNLIKKPIWDTNKRYLGHNENNIPVYINEKLGKGEIKEYMENEKQDWKELADGIYIGKVVEGPYLKPYDDGKERYIVKIGNLVNKKTNEAVTDPESIIICYLTKGGNDVALNICQEQINNIITDFKLNSFEELYDQEVQVESYTNKHGYKNYQISKIRNTYDFTQDETLPAKIINGFKHTKSNGYCLLIEFTKDDVVYNDVIYYPVNNKYNEVKWNTLIKKLGLTNFTLQQLKLINPKCTIKVSISKSLDKNGKPYVNKDVIL